MLMGGAMQLPRSRRRRGSEVVEEAADEGTVAPEMTLHILTPRVMSLLFMLFLLALPILSILIHSLVLILLILLLSMLRTASCLLLAGTFIVWMLIGMMLLSRRSRTKVRVRTMPVTRS